MRQSVLTNSIVWIPVCCLGGILYASDAKEPPAVDAQRVANRALKPAERIKRLESILAEAKQKIRKKDEELSSIAEIFGTDDPEQLNGELQATIDGFQRLRTELYRVREEQSEAESRLKAFNSNVSKSDERPKATEPPASPVKPAKTSIRPEKVAENADRDRIEETDSEREDPAERLGKQSSKARIKTFLTSKLEILAKHETLLVDEMKGLEEDAKNLGRTAVELELKQKEIDNIGPIVIKLTEEIERARVELDMINPN